MGEPDAPQGLRIYALASMIPMVLIVGPLLGYGLGAWIDRRWMWLTPWGSGVGTALGLIAAGRQAWQLIRRIQAVHQR